MKNAFLLLALTALLGATATSSMANDVGPGEAVKLLESGTVLPYDELDKIALKDHPGATIEETELEHEYGKYIYQVDLRDQQHQQWQVDIDATTGEVLSSEQDD